MLKEPNLPESLIPGCLDILCKISNNERDYIRVVVEDVITDLREGEVEEESEVGQGCLSPIQRLVSCRTDICRLLTAKLPPIAPHPPGAKSPVCPELPAHWPMIPKRG